ncbi:DUF3375 domain-containing protein [Aquipuribacter nitratireducens]|uniref:DUF3375 domain-containing protein n=1 Tax=Aquipuribacter nitratireducens TaxID=650104 RepID=A0ABW0GI57_9MICO
MEHDELDSLRRHPAWRLLSADSAPLVLDVLGAVFVDSGGGPMAETDLVQRVDDHLFALSRTCPGRYPRPALEYVRDWAEPGKGWLRAFYPPGSDGRHYDVTPAVEKALRFLDGLRARSFVGTESRLDAIVTLLRDLALGSEPDTERRLSELERRRAELDREIEAVRTGRSPLLSDTAQAERFDQVTRLAVDLLSDFRQVEENFRTLDRQLRERVTRWEGPKAGLLDEIVGSRAGIAESDQGRSFHAFFDFLLSSSRQEEFRELLAQVHDRAGAPSGARTRRVHHDWLAAGQRTQETVRSLSEQLRRFVDDQTWLENRRVLDLVRSIEQHALALRDTGPIPVAADLPDTHPSLVLPMERPLYRPRTKAAVASDDVVEADAVLDATALFEQVVVDRERLVGAVGSSLAGAEQVPLAAVVGRHPLREGLAELVAYYTLSAAADTTFDSVVDDTATDRIGWTDRDGVDRVATVPRLVFTR